VSGAFIYYSPDGAWSQDLGTEAVRLGSINGLMEKAALGDPGEGLIVVDDPFGTQGHSSDGILGLKTFKWTESDAPTDDKIIWIGYVADRDYYTADSLITGVARKIGVQLVELNAAFGFEVIRPNDPDAIRPQGETVDDRLAWLLSSGYLDAADNGLVASSSATLDFNNYQNQYPLQVMQDIADGADLNFFLYYDETASQISLFLDDFNTSTAYTSGLKLSNVRTDIDDFNDPAAVTFNYYNCHVGVSPLRVASGGSMPYASASIYLNRPATALAFALRDKIFPNSNVKTPAMATRQLTRMLRQNATEDASVTLSVDLPPGKVNGIRRGHRIQYRNRWMGSPVDYTEDTWMRVVERSIKQDKMTPERYTLDLRLSPQEAPRTSCAGLDLTQDGTYWPLGGATDYFNATDGINPFYMCRPGLAFPVVPTTGFIGRWFFKTFGSSGGGPGTVDSAGDGVGNTLRAVVVGNGTLTVQTVNVEGVGSFNVTVKRQTSLATPTSESDFTIVSTTGYSTGDQYSVTIDDAVTPYCVSIIEADSITSKDMGWSQGVWVSAP
jgi:hypothetical protein